MPARAYTIPISPKLATAYNNETFPFLETRLMNGRVWLTTSRFIRGNGLTKAVLISVSSSWLEVSTKVVTFAEAMPLVHGVSYSKESQPFGSIEFPESALKRTQRKVTGFPAVTRNKRSEKVNARLRLIPSNSLWT